MASFTVRRRDVGHAPSRAPSHTHLTLSPPLLSGQQLTDISGSGTHSDDGGWSGGSRGCEGAGEGGGGTTRGGGCGGQPDTEDH